MQSVHVVSYVCAYVRIAIIFSNPTLPLIVFIYIRMVLLVRIIDVICHTFASSTG